LTDEQLLTLAKLTERLTALNVTAKFDGLDEGPVVSVYKFRPVGSTRVTQLEALAADFAVATGTEAVMVKRLPGESAVGVFVPNAERKGVTFRDAMTALHQDTPETRIPLCLGIDNYGGFIIEDLVDMPHLLIAGSTGSGKSTLLNSILASVIYSTNSQSVNFILSDTKGVEFGQFEKAPHVLFPRSTTVYDTCERMEWLVSETDRRMKKFANGGYRNIHEFKTAEAKFGGKALPFIVLVIDELADILADRSKHEDSRLSIGKLAQSQLGRIVARSRAAGVYVIASTQRPSVDVVTGVIKANFPARISFRLPSQTDSRTVLNTGGAENLLSQGDMLFWNQNKPGLQRIHAPLTPLEDVIACVEYATVKAGS
jgi:DNA segregation ATPase FtsK/SpoIIIE, S-DNA-T family